MPELSPLIGKLLEQATEIYLGQIINPFNYAETAAHMIVRAAAAEIHAESADAVCVIAAMTYATKICENAYYSSKLATESATRLESSKRYNYFLSSSRQDLNISSQSMPVTFHGLIANNPLQATLAELTSRYHELFADSLAKESLSKACGLYPYAHACVYESYIHSVAIAARKDKAYQPATFQQAMRSKLMLHFGESPVDPSLFMQLIQSSFVYNFMLCCAVIGIVALIIGVCAMTIPTMGSAFISIGISSALLTGVASATVFLGIAMFAGRYETQRSWENANKLSKDSLEESQNLSMESRYINTTTSL